MTWQRVYPFKGILCFVTLFFTVLISLFFPYLHKIHVTSDHCRMYNWNIGKKREKNIIRTLCLSKDRQGDFNLVRISNLPVSEFMFVHPSDPWDSSSQRSTVPSNLTGVHKDVEERTNRTLSSEVMVPSFSIRWWLRFSNERSWTPQGKASPSRDAWTRKQGIRE